MEDKWRLSEAPFQDFVQGQQHSENYLDYEIALQPEDTEAFLENPANLDPELANVEYYGTSETVNMKEKCREL